MKKLKLLPLKKFSEKKEIRFYEKRYRFVQHIPAYFDGFDKVNIVFNNLEELFGDEFFDEFKNNEKFENCGFITYENRFYIVFNYNKKDFCILIGFIFYNFNYDGLKNFQRKIIDEHLIYEFKKTNNLEGYKNYFKL